MNQSTIANITGVVNITLMAVPTIYLLLYGNEYGFSRIISAVIGFGTGLLFAILFSIATGFILKNLSGRRYTLQLTKAFAAGDLVEVERLMKEQAVRLGISESEIQAVVNNATVDVEIEARKIAKNIQSGMSANEDAFRELKK